MGFRRATQTRKMKNEVLLLKKRLLNRSLLGCLFFLPKILLSCLLIFFNVSESCSSSKEEEIRWGVAKDRGAKENNQPSPSIGELSLSYSQWDRLDSRNPLFCKLEIRMWYLYSLVIMVESVKKCVLPYFMAPPAP